MRHTLNKKTNMKYKKYISYSQPARRSFWLGLIIPALWGALFVVALYFAMSYELDNRAAKIRQDNTRIISE
jgi:4-hydroxybenzoate polyprenyltransferase